MTTEKLIEFLQKQEKKDILLNLQGIIITTILIKKMQLAQVENKLILQNEENVEEKIGFNLSQLMRITKMKKNEILLEFDQLQEVTIIIKKHNKKSYLSKRKIAFIFSD